jgi:hypothetical protein
MMKRSSFAPLALLALVGCGITGPESTRRLAVIEFSETEPVVVEVPATATRGTAFQVAINSYGGGCIGQGPTEVAVNGLTATVEPYQFELVDGNSTCTDDLRTYRHLAQVRFEQAGTGRIVFRGHSRLKGETITVERTVVVQAPAGG